MKIKIEIDEGLPEDEVLIRCRGLTEQIADVQKAVSEVINTSQKFVFYRGNTEYYLTLDEILFFETDSDGSVKALNAKGELDPSCTEVIDKTLKQFTISRDTDANDGQLAPSGFTPIVRNISQR